MLIIIITLIINADRYLTDMTSENAEVYPGNAAYPNPTFSPNQPPPQPHPGYPPTAPGMDAYDPTKQPMGPGVPAG